MSPPVTPARFRHAPEYLFPHAQSSQPDLVRANTVQNQNASNASRKAGYVHPKSSAVWQLGRSPITNALACNNHSLAPSHAKQKNTR